jgi:tight adherence protein B
MSTALAFLFFGFFAVFLVACAGAFLFLEKRRKKDVEKVLRTVTDKPAVPMQQAILIRKPGEGGALAALLRRFNIVGNIATNISQAGLDWNVGQFGIASLALAAVGALLGFRLDFLVFRSVSCLMSAVVMGSLPYWYVRFKRKKRFAEFEEQFPEALDFLARSMRAGHAFSVSLEMLGQETPDPLGREFRALFNEQNLGGSIDAALEGLVRRVPLVDTRFFVSAVLLQRQTGGNLSEILTRLAYVIRERFRVKGQVKAASAHGRITAAILTVMPLLLAIALSILAPGYLTTMAKDSDGKYILLGAVAAQAIGYYFIRRIVNIKV